jgi:hypothetical protein
MISNCYVSTRHMIRTGDVFFTASNALFSRIIRTVRRASISHCGIFVVLAGRVFTVECLEGSKCKMVPASTRFAREKTYTIMRGKPVDPETILKDVDVIEYDLFGAVMSPFFRNTLRELYCAEGLAKWENVLLEHLKRGITPDDLYTYFLALNKKNP